MSVRWKGVTFATCNQTCSQCRRGWVNSLLRIAPTVDVKQRAADTGMEAEAWRLWRLRSSMSCSICVVLP